MPSDKGPLRAFSSPTTTSGPSEKKQATTQKRTSWNLVHDKLQLTNYENPGEVPGERAGAGATKPAALASLGKSLYIPEFVFVIGKGDV